MRKTYPHVPRSASMLTQAKLKELVHYDPESGVFTWRVRPSHRIHVGDRAGSMYRGYRTIGIFCIAYPEHQLAWFYVYGVLPERVDHDDGDGTNNRIKNLRPCTHAQNLHNTKKRIDNSSGSKGVHLRKDTDRYTAYINVNNKRTYLGCFDTSEDAHEFRNLASDLLHGEFSNHGVHKCVSANI